MTALGLTERALTLACGFWWGTPRFKWCLTGVAIAGLAFRVLRTHQRNSITASLLDDVARSILTPHALSLEFNGPDDAIITLNQGTARAGRLLVDVFVQLVIDGPVTLAISAYLLYYFGAGAALVGIVGALVGAGILTLLRREVLRESGAAWRAYQNLMEDLSDAIDGRVDIVAAASATSFLSRFSTHGKIWRRTVLRADLVAAASSRGPFLLVIAMLLGVVFLGHVDSKSIVNGIILAIGLGSLSGAVHSLTELAKGRSEVEPVLRVLACHDDQAVGSVVKANVLACDKATYAYPSAPHPALENVTLSVEKATAFAGPNGCGKTTLLWLLLGLRQPTRGTVQTNAGLLRNISGDAWRRRLVFLPQRAYLPARRDVRTAIALTAPEADEARVVASLERVELYARLCAKASDPLGVRVDQLSAGERQRLALARALARDADVYLLDEPDANLDASGVALVAKLMRELADAGKIVVVAAHTPELLAAADRVVHLEAGRVTRIEERRAPRADSPT